MKKKNKKEKSKKLWEKAQELIPGGVQLLSKHPNIHLPVGWPTYFKKAKGIEIEDLDGNKYIDFSIMGVGTCNLGYADHDVNKVVKKTIDEGNISTFNPPEEVELAETLCKIHPWAQMARFTKTGGEAAMVSVRIARAYTGKDKIAFCGYHGWHDWYLSVNLSDDDNLEGHLLPGLKPRGVPKVLKDTSLPFEYNKIEQLEKIVKENDIGVIIMEPIRHTDPKNDFLKKVRKIADKHKIVLIFDEISSGFRMTLGGIHLKLGVTPDIAIFGKAISNGYPLSAVIGKKEIMKTAEDAFISSTYWTDRIGYVAALATIKKMEEKNVPKHIDKIGSLIGKNWQKLINKHKLKASVHGPNALITLSFEYENNNEIITLFTQEMLKRGFLAFPTVYVSYAHTEKLIKKYLGVADEVFGIIKKAIDENNVSKLLESPVRQPKFKRLND